MKKDQQPKRPQNRKTKDPADTRPAWQTGEYSRNLEMLLPLPVQFLLLCKLVEVTPRKMLFDFMASVSGDSWTRPPNEECRASAVEYFNHWGYGQGFYTEQEITQILKDLHAIGSLWPANAEMPLIDQHAAWRNKYWDYWFNKWYQRLRRKP